ncbi:MAG: BrxA family protein [Acidimicrobiia bacterium]
MTRLSSNIVKAGALIDDTLRFVEVWDPVLSPEANLERVVDSNLLGLPSQKRIYDTLTYALRPRYVDPGPAVIPGLTVLSGNGAAFRDACYFETTRVDQLLARFAEGPLFEWHEQGRLAISAEDVVDWIGKQAANGELPDWSDSLTRRVGQGLLSTLRDFGMLAGATRSQRKDINPRPLSIPGFAYVAFRLHQEGMSSRALLTSKVWRRWLLHESQVLGMLHRAHGTGALAFESAGTAIRIDWSSESLVEVVRAAA